MYRASTLAFLLFFTLFSAHSQQKEVSLEEIWNGTFRPKGVTALRSMADGREYTVLERSAGEVRIDRYEYKGLAKKGTVISSARAGVPEFSTYAFDREEKKLLLGAEIEPIYRRSRLGKYYVHDLEEKTTVAIAEYKVQQPTFSPDGGRVAYVHDNDIHVFDLATGRTDRLTDDGEYGAIINGLTDWVYEEEFAFVRAYEWNATGDRLAFLRFDESAVPMFSMDIYGKALYPQPHTFKYPKAGEANAKVTLHVIDFKKDETWQVDLGDAYYVPKIKWMNHADMLSVQVMNRHQNEARLIRVDTKRRKVDTLLVERDDAYVDLHEGSYDNVTFLADDSFIWSSEKDGWNHLYLYDEDGGLMTQITQGPWEVTDYYGYDQKNDRVYYQSTERGSIYRDVYSVDSNGNDKRRLTDQAGRNDARFSDRFLYFVNTHSSVTSPPEYTLHLARDGMAMQLMRDNRALVEKLEGYDLVPKEFSTIQVNGNELNMYLMKPADFDPSKKYPLFMYQYSGPGSQNVADRWASSNDYWHQMLVAQGYIVACVDGRGTGFKGRDFKKSTYMNLVKYETEDQIEAARLLSERPYIDAERTGIWGWSFGGHMSTNCLLKGADVFEMAIAVAPVTSWRFYDTIYTERFLRTPQENPAGYDDNSPFNYPELLQGKYLLVHGSGDDNVHVQNSMRMVEALVQANKPFEWAIYPDRNHGIYGGNTRLHLYTKMTEFIKANL